MSLPSGSWLWCLVSKQETDCEKPPLLSDSNEFFLSKARIRSYLTGAPRDRLQVHGEIDDTVAKLHYDDTIYQTEGI